MRSASTGKEGWQGRDGQAFAKRTLGLPTNAVLRDDLEIVTVADAPAVRRGKAQHPVLRSYAETTTAPRKWACQRRVLARIEANTMGMDTLAMAQRLGTVRQAELAANVHPTQSRHRAVGMTVWGAGGISPEIAGL